MFARILVVVDCIVSASVSIKQKSREMAMVGDIDNGNVFQPNEKDQLQRRKKFSVKNKKG
jgi:hypothetical protein